MNTLPNFDHNSSLDLLRVVLKKYKATCDALDFDYEYHYVEDVQGDENNIHDIKAFLKKYPNFTANHLSAREHAANMLANHVVSQGSGCKEFLSTNWQTTSYSSNLKFRFSNLPQCGFAITGNFGDMFFANAHGEGWLRDAVKNLIKTGEADFDHVAEHMYASAIFADGEDRNWRFYVLLYAAAYFFAAES